MSYGSKIISYRIAALRENAARAFALAPAVAAAFAREHAMLVDREAGEAAPDYGRIQELVGRTLDDQAAKMAELHQEHHHWRARERYAKAKLRDAAVALRGALREVRHLFDTFFGVRKGVAKFPGRDDLQRLPMHSLENVSAGLLRVLDDDAFGWSASAYDVQAHHVREWLAGRLADYREAGTALMESRGKRAHAAAERERRIAECEKLAAGLTQLLRGLCSGAGFDNAARGLKPRLPRARRSRKKAANAAPMPSAI